MMKNPLVNQKKCLKCGTCTAIAPNTFVTQKNGKAGVKIRGKGDSLKAIKEAIKNCPGKCIFYKK